MARRYKDALIPTGIAPIDDALGGGMNLGESYAVLGFTGSGRTTLSCMVAAEGAARAFRDTNVSKWCVVAASEGRRETLHRVFSYLARVPMVDVASWWRTAREAPEAKRMAAADNVADETASDTLSRVLWAHTVMTSRLVVVDGTDMSGVSRHSVCAPLNRVVYSAVHSNDLRGIVVDDMSAFVDAYMKVTNKPPNAESGVFKKMHKELYNHFCKHSSCHLWVVHHLRHALARTPAWEQLHHYDTARCRMLGRMFSACFVLGNRDRNGRLLLHCSKTPIEERVEPRVVRFDDVACGIVDDREGAISMPPRHTEWSPGPINIDAGTLEEICGIVAKTEQDTIEQYGRPPRQIEI